MADKRRLFAPEELGNWIYFQEREFLTKLGVQSLRLYLAGTNLLTFTSLDDYDPEKLSTDSRNDVHPNTRTYSLVLTLNFKSNNYEIN